jgi:hypothetical protein
MELIRTFKDKDYEVQNHIKIEGGNYIHRQVETKGGKTYMRIKQRKLFEINPLLKQF